MLEAPVIVHVGPSHLPLPARLGGAIERRMLELAEAQARTGERVVIYSGGAETGWRSYRGVSIRYLEGSRLEFAAHFVQDVRSRGPRIIHVHNRPEIAWCIKSAGLAPVVLSCDYHFEPGRRIPYLRTVTKALWRRCLLACDRIAPVSGYCLETQQAYWGLPREKYAMIHNGVDCARFRPDEPLRRQWRNRLAVNGKPVILFAGRLCEQKGTGLLLAAYRQLQRAAALIVAGPCGQFGKTHVTPLAGEVGVAGGLYLAPVDDDELPGLYNACDIFVMPTRELEMFGMAAVEAQACGKPVVASDHGGLRETVPDSAGIRFPNGDAAALAAACDALLAQPQLREKLAAGARQNAARFDWPRIAERCQEVYAAL